MRIVMGAIRFVCYAALVFVVSGIAAVTYVSETGGCPRLDEGAVQCVSPFYQTVGEYGLAVLLIAGFAGVPALLALAGVVFLVRDVYRLIASRRRTATIVGR